MKQAKTYRLFAVFCWLGTAISGGLMGYMRHLAGEYPTIETFTRNTRIAGVLLMLWLPVAVFFTIRACQEKKEKK